MVAVEDPAHVTELHNHHISLTQLRVGLFPLRIVMRYFLYRRLLIRLNNLYIVVYSLHF